uniref:Small ribosomal subunit protein uS2c n=1 Tax=Caulerpa okamurae TaxID=118247 RepID=A0A3S5FWU4_9CHLO|nr:30S ribosomal protein S2 [Caulerpa okamurae]
MKLEAQTQLQEMFDAGVHLGHRRRQGNPKMLPYIYKEKDDFQIIDLLQTHWYLKIACKFLFDRCSRGKKVLFVGTNRHIGKSIEQRANNCNCWYINKRWLGGFLTNWITMEKSILKMEQNQLIESTRLKRQKIRLEKYLGGVKTMKKLPDIVIIVGQQKEINAVRECQKLKIPSITIVDTNCDPSLTDLLIPGNDDSLSSVNFILNKLEEAIREGQKNFQKKRNFKKKFNFRQKNYKRYNKLKK